MAICPIAGAACAGKGAYDRAAILRTAHATARRVIATSRPGRSYKRALAQALRYEWYQAKRAKAQAEVEAEDANPVALPADVVAHAASLRLAASYEPHTFAGHERFDALHREATQLEEAALAAIQLSQRGGSHLVAR